MSTDKYWKISAIIILTALIVGAVLVLAPRKLKMESGNAEFVIAGGQSLGATARLLAERGLIYSRYFFVAYAVFTGHEKDFKAGRYLLPPAVSTRGLVEIFSSGQSEPEDIEVTIPEGTNIADIDKIFAKAGLIRKDDFLSFSKGLISWPEGELFPDTYRFKPPEPGENLAVSEIIQKMKDNFRTRTKGLLGSSSEGVANKKQEAIIVASILEKEVKTEVDMRLVAGIIEKRLKLGMPLEIDATVAYGVCLPKFLLGRYCDVSLANIVDNIRIDSEYNTYKRKGLPAGPISNPGLIAIRAALNPQPSDYLYYLTTKEGVTVFSKTAAEHIKARQKYLN